MPTPTTFKGLVSGLAGILDKVIIVIIGVVFVYMVWKIFDAWIINAGDEKKREAGKQTAFVAVVVMVIMLTAWGIVTMLKNSFFG